MWYTCSNIQSHWSSYYVAVQILIMTQWQHVTKIKRLLNWWKNFSKSGYALNNYYNWIISICLIIIIWIIIIVLIVIIIIRSVIIVIWTIIASWLTRSHATGRWRRSHASRWWRGTTRWKWRTSKWRSAWWGWPPTRRRST